MRKEINVGALTEMVIVYLLAKAVGTVEVGNKTCGRAPNVRERRGQACMWLGWATGMARNKQGS